MVRYQKLPVSCWRRHDLALGTSDFLGEPANIGCTNCNLAPRFGQRLALFRGQQKRKRLLVVHQRVMKVLKQTHALRKIAAGIAVKCPCRGLDRAPCFFGTAIRHGSYDLARRRVRHVDR